MKPGAAAGLLAAAGVGAFFYGREIGLAGLGVGLVGGGFGVGALWLTIRMMAASAQASRPPAAGIGLALLMVAAKIPVLLSLAGASRQIGDAAFDCFLAGVMLVYFAVVGGAAASAPKDETPSSHGPSAG